VATVTVNDALLALVAAAVPQVTVFDAGAPDEDGSEPVPERYAVFWPDSGTPEKGQVSNQSRGRIYRWQVTAVAPDRGMAEWIATKIAAALEDQRPSIPGFSCGQIDHTFSLPVRRDEQVLSRRVIVAMDRYELLAEQI
jgi:hypothetical protein